MDDFEAAPSSKRPLRIALVDDHELLLGGLAQALSGQPSIEDVAAYHDPARLLDELKQGREFDLVVTDMLMGETNGLTLAQDLKRAFDMPVLLMTGVEAPPSPDDLARYGIQGLVHKTAPIEVLQEAIVAIGSGQSFFQFPQGWAPHKAAPKFGRQSEQAGEGAVEGLLSERQFEVLKLVAAGAANKEIAKSLDITENTVKTHLKHVFAALGVTKRTACVQAAKSRGLLE